MPTIAASRVVTPSGVLQDVEVDLEDDRIAAVRPCTGAAPDRWLVPGFVDLQVNGIDDVDVTDADGDDWARLDALLLGQGVTTWCPTLVTMPLPAYAASLARIASASRRSPGGRPHIAGVHMEGPFLGGAPGAHRREHLSPIDLAWLAGLPDVVKVMTLAPELAGATTAITQLTGRGVLVSVGHTTASYEQVLAAADAGARLVTHLYNGMGGLHHRQPGVVGAALADGRLATSLIADLVHVHPAALRIAFAAKGDHAVLVTDAVAWDRPSHAGQTIERGPDGAPRLPDGTLAGSALTMDAAVRNVVHATGVTVEQAVTAASTTPARLLGLQDRGAVEPGRRGDLVALTPALEVEAVWVGGTLAHG
ncbi:MAG TPA: N-acetylglucosamine-6-phosphate deacetylase [Acidimicrobiales bacterium]|nr:N-acetylglucosamine-6-phosphate deacetylase [Acidimicrobiales bacterium]